jgi:hypothetical protein
LAPLARRIFQRDGIARPQWSPEESTSGSGGEKVAKLDVQLDTADSPPAQYPLPEVSRVRIQRQEFGV